MRSLLCTFLALLMGASAYVPLPAGAAPHVIAELGADPLVPPIASTAQLQSDVANNKQLFTTAAEKLGLTPQEYAQFELRVRTGRVAYVTIPRHLDAMTSGTGDSVRVLRDVIVPADTRGWEVDLNEQAQILSIYVPARCGNISLLRKPAPRVAHLARHNHAHVAALRKPAAHHKPVAAPAVAGAVPQTQNAPAAVPASPAPAPTATSTPAPYAVLASSTGPSHHLAWLPFLVIPLIGAFIGHGGGGAPEVPVVPIVQGPPPVVAIARPGPGGLRIPLPTPPPGCVPTPNPH